MAKDWSYLIGTTKGLLTVNSLGFWRNGNATCLQLFCTCKCGKEVHYRPDRFLKVKYPSCGCYKSERFKAISFKDGRTSYRSYYTWFDMISRCHNEKNIQYKGYGGRGITVCTLWRNDFLAFLNDMGEKPKGLTIERIDNNQGYYPDNCKWGYPKRTGAKQETASKKKIL